MTYSTNLDPNVPGQGEFARLGAGRIRALTKALKERLESVFESADADPLKFKPEYQSMKIASVSYTFPDPTVLVAGNGELLSIILPSDVPALPADSPTIANWRSSAQVDNFGRIMVSAFFSGIVYFYIFNPTLSNIVLTGETLDFTVFYQPT